MIWFGLSVAISVGKISKIEISFTLKSLLVRRSQLRQEKMEDIGAVQGLETSRFMYSIRKRKLNTKLEKLI